MCFSPTASFGAAAMLSATGAASLVSSRTPAQRFLSCMPVLFAVQQLAEGFLWLSLLHPDWSGWHEWSKYGFLIVAQALWPLYVPLAILLLERDERRKKLLRLLTIAGALFAGYALYALFSHRVVATIEQHHIRYVQDFALSKKWYYGLLYFIPTILAPLASGNKPLRSLGYLFFGSYIVARLMFHFYVISVWCFFGAIISIVVLYLVRERSVGKTLTAEMSVIERNKLIP